MDGHSSSGPYTVLLLAALTSSALGQDPLYFPVGESLVLSPPEHGSVITSVVWTHNTSLAVEWVNNEVEFFRSFIGRTSLNQRTAQLTVSAATLSDGGEYRVEINNVWQSQVYSVRVIKKVPKPSVVVSPPSCSRYSSECSFTCEGDRAGTEPLTSSWKHSGRWKLGHWIMNLIDDWTTKTTTQISCSMKNPVSEENMKQTIQCLQDQLNLLTLETQSDYTDLCTSSRALLKPLQSLQQNISTGCSTVEHQASTQADLLCSTSLSLASSLRLSADESQQTLEEMTGCCSHLHSSVSGLVERDLQWSSGAREHAETRAQEHLTLMRQSVNEAQNLRQSVETRCTKQLHKAKEELSCRQQEVKRVLVAVQEQNSSDRIVLDEQQAELRDHVETSHQLVYGFLQDELQQDVSTGATPQRRQFSYPKQLVKSQSRGELLDSRRRQQEELFAAMEEEEEPEEEDRHSQVEHDSLEDELSTCNESLATEPSFVDENLVFNESKRLPFFKQKGGKKEMKIHGRQKMLEAEDALTPQKSRLPLRCQN